MWPSRRAFPLALSEPQTAVKADSLFASRLTPPLSRCLPLDHHLRRSTTERLAFSEPRFRGVFCFSGMNPDQPAALKAAQTKLKI